MNDHTVLAHHIAARFLIVPLTALYLIAPVVARAEDKDEATKVAKKLARAVAKAHDAKEEREALRHFQEDVNEYAELHDKQLAKLGPRTDARDDPQQALAAAIKRHRDSAKPGDIFNAHVQPIFRRLIAEQLSGPDTLAARKAVIEGNPAEEEDSVPVVVRINGEYTNGAPRSTVPPSVLLTLPPLPECLNYRFVGRDLILVDAVAQIIVDFLPAAAPALVPK
jgi:hypothetical protein